MGARRVVAILMAIGLAATGCTSVVTGTPVGGESAPGLDTLFAGDVPDYGQNFNQYDKALLAYARALRRIDPCGFLPYLKNIGDLGRVAGDFEGCTGALKVAGRARDSAIGVAVSLDEPSSTESQAFRVGDTQVYGGDNCVFKVPLALSGLSGAPRTALAEQPQLEVTVIDDTSVTHVQDTRCELARPAITALVGRLPSGIPVRHALSAYPIKLAERDPCEILADYPGRVREVSVDILGDPFGCEFSLDDKRVSYTVSIGTSVDGPYGDYRRESRGGAEYFYHEDHHNDTACDALAQLGEPLYAKQVGGTLDRSSGRDPMRQTLRASIYMSRHDGDCGPLRDLLDKAVRIFGDSAR